MPVAAFVISNWLTAEAVVWNIICALPFSSAIKCASSIKNSGSESYIRFYCESSNAHYSQLQASPHSAYSGNVTLVLPASADTLVGRATTDTLTNKTLTL